MSARQDRGLPHDWELERAVLGILLLNDSTLDEVRGILKPGDFHAPRHQALFELVCAMADAGEPVDVLTVGGRIEQSSNPAEYGGIAYVTGLPNFAAVVEHAGGYARKVGQLTERRAAILALRKLEDALLTNPSVSPAASLAELLNTLDANARGVDDSWIAIGDASAGAVRETQSRAESPGELPGIPTGWSDLDRLIAGWRPSRVYVLAARPKMGKSAFIEQTAIHAATLGHGVGFVSLEMDRLEIGERALAMLGRVDAGRMVRGEIDDEDWRRLLDADDLLSRLPLFIADRPAQTLAHLRAQAKHLRRRCEKAGTKLGLLVIDYLQLMGGDGDRGTTREQVVSALSRGIKLLAKELEIPILLLSQLSRKVEERGEKRPLPSDLRESGSIEQDADAVIFLYRDEVYNPDSVKRGVCEVIVSTIRGGQAGKVDLAYIGHQYRFASLADRVSDPPPAHQRRGGKPGGRPAGADPHDTESP